MAQILGAQMRTLRTKLRRPWGTMAGFEDSRPKTQAKKLAPAGAILCQF